MTIISFIDTETLGLDPDKHAIWEVGLVRYDTTARTVLSEHLWQIDLTVSQIEAGDPIGMDVGRFAERYQPATAGLPSTVLAALVALTDRTHLAGAVPSFDEERLRRMCARYGFKHYWHYHLIDVEAAAIGYLSARGEALTLPWKSDDLSARLGVTVSDEDRHTALGDAKWALRIWQAIEAPQTQERHHDTAA